MIINLFKTSQVSGIVFLVIFQLLIFLNAILHGVPIRYNTEDTILYEILIESWAHKLKWLNISLSFMLIFTQAMVYNYLTIQLNLLGKTTYLPAFFYLLVSCMLPSNILLNSGIIAASFIVPAVYLLMTATASKHPLRTVFNISLLFSLGSIFYLQALFYFPFLILSLGILGLLNGRSFLTCLAGFILPYSYIVTYHFVMDELPWYWRIQFENLVHLIPRHLTMHYTEWALYALLMIILGLALFKYLTTRFTLKVIQRKLYNVFTVFFLGSLIIPLFFEEVHKQQLVLLAIPVGVYLSFYFLSLKKQWVADVFTALLFIVITILQIEFYAV